MKLTNVILSTNASDLYASYWPYASEVWHHFGVHPILIRLTEDSSTFKYSSPFGTVIDVPAIPNLSTVWQAQIVRFFAAAVIPGNNMTYDIDMFPCSNALLKQLDQFPESGIIARTDIKTVAFARRFGAGGIIASNEIFQRIFTANKIQLSSLSFWNAEVWEQCKNIKRDIHLGCTKSEPGLDELFFFQCVINALSEIPFVISFGYPGKYLLTTRTVDSTTHQLSYPMPTVQEYERKGIFRDIHTYCEAHICRDVDKELTARLIQAICSESE